MHHQSNQLLASAIQSFQGGNFDEAEHILLQVLKIQPENFDALHISGIVKGMKNQHEDALAFFRKALKIDSNNSFLNFNIAKAFSEIGEEDRALKYHLSATKLNPTHPEAWLNFGKSLTNLKKYKDSLDCYNKALALYPEYVEALSNRGVVLTELEQYEEALVSIDESLKINPEMAETWFNRGIALNALQQYHQALTSYDKAISINSDFTDAWFNRGNVFKELQQYEQALASYEKAININSDFADAWFNCGVVRSELKQYEHALACYDKAISINFDFADAWFSRGNALKELQEYEQALNSYDKAIDIKPEYPDAWSNRGNALKELQQYEQALYCYDKAISINPHFVDAWFNRGVVLSELQQYEQALASYNKVIGIESEYVEAYWNKSLIQLLNGDFQCGWSNYEYRWLRKYANKKLHQEIPNLTSLSGLKSSTVLVWAEQGFGDTIQFSRFANLLVQHEVNVVFEVQAPLKSLFQQSFPSLRIITRDEPINDVDFQVPLMSLPRLFSTALNNIPSTNSYLTPIPKNLALWKDRLKLNSSKLNIGIACSGSETHKNDHNRSMALSLFRPMSNLANLFLIQKNVRDSDKNFLNHDSKIQFLGDQISSFEDSASIVEMMDLIITVDTSLAHLSGALGKPTKLLINWNSEWRWLLNRQSSPWYPTVKIFRQPKAGDWESVIQEVISEQNLRLHAEQTQHAKL